MKQLHHLLITLVFFLGSVAWSQARLRYEGFVEDGGVPVVAAGETFQVRIRKPGCASTLGLIDWSSNSIGIVNGEFILTPEFDENAFAIAMDPNITWGCAAGSAREMHILWRGETFIVNLQDAPKSSFSTLSNNSLRLGGVQASPTIACTTNEYLTVNGTGQLDCTPLIPLAVGDIPSATPLAGNVTGSLGASVVQAIQNIPVTNTAPTVNQVLKYNGAQWAPAADDSGAAPAPASYAAQGIVQFDTSAAVSGINVVAGVASLPNTITAAGPIGNAQNIPVITYDAKGRLTNVGTVAVDDNTKLPISGGALTGPLSMSNQNITAVNALSATSLGTRNVTIYDSDSSNFAVIQTPTALGANYNLTLPPDDGAAGQVLATDGNGVLNWTAASSGIAVTANRAVISNGTGTGLVDFSCPLGQAFSFDGAGNPSCLPVTGAGGFINTGNSFGAAATLGTNDNFDLRFETNNTERMTVTNGGYVGIGNNTPSHPLTVAGNFLGDVVSIQNLSAGGYSSIQFRSNTGLPIGSIGYGNSSVTPSEYQNLMMLITDNQDISFNTGSTALTERVRIDASTGNIGVGTANPNSLLHVRRDQNNSTFMRVENMTNGTNSKNGIMLSNADGDIGGVLTASSAFSNPQLRSRLSIQSSPTSTGTNIMALSTGGDIRFFAGGENISDERMRISNNGVAIGNVIATSALDIDGALTMRQMSTPLVPPSTQGRIYYDSSVGKFRVSETGLPFIDLIPNYNPNSVVVTDGLGDPQSVTCANGELISFQSGAPDCSTPSEVGGFVNGGNSFGGSANIGTNDNNALFFRTNNMTQMALSTEGNLGIGNLSPLAALDISKSTMTTSNFTAFNSNVTATPSANHTGRYNSGSFYLMTTGTNNVNQAFTQSISLNRNSTGTTDGSFVGSDIMVYNSSAGYVNEYAGTRSVAQVDAGGAGSATGGVFSARSSGSASLNSVIGLKSGTFVNTGASTTTAVGIDVTVENLGTTTNAIGINIGPIQGTNRTAINQTDSAARNIFMGQVGVGTSNPSANLQVNGTTRLGASSSTISKVIFCNPTVSLGFNLGAGASTTISSGGGTCTGVEDQMVLSCNWTSDTGNLGQHSWNEVGPDSADQTNNRIRIRLTNNDSALQIPSGAQISLRCMGFRP